MLQLTGADLKTTSLAHGRPSLPVRKKKLTFGTYTEFHELTRQRGKLGVS